MDFSETSRDAFEYALLLGNRLEAEVVVLHVVEDVPLFTAYAGMPLVEMRQELERSAKSELSRLITQAGADPARVRTDLVHGTTHDAILLYARQQECDLMVMGTHGRGGLDHAFFGSTTERVMRRSPCPVLVVRPKPKRP